MDKQETSPQPQPEPDVAPKAAPKAAPKRAATKMTVSNPSEVSPGAAGGEAYRLPSGNMRKDN